MQYTDPSTGITATANDRIGESFLKSFIAIGKKRDQQECEWVTELKKSGVEDPEAKLRGMQKAQREAAVAVNDLAQKVADCDTAIRRDEKELDHLYDDRKKYRDNARMLARIEKDIEETIERIDRVRANREEYVAKMAGKVVTDDEIASRVDEIDRINAVLKLIGDLDFAQRRRLIELLDIRAVLGVEDGHQYVDILWYGDNERRWLGDDKWLDSPTSG